MERSSRAYELGSFACSWYCLSNADSIGLASPALQAIFQTRSFWVTVVRSFGLQCDFERGLFERATPYLDAQLRTPTANLLPYLFSVCGGDLESSSEITNSNGSPTESHLVLCALVPKSTWSASVSGGAFIQLSCEGICCGRFSS